MLTRKNLISLLSLAVIALALPVAVTFVKTTQVFQSRADAAAISYLSAQGSPLPTNAQKLSVTDKLAVKVVLNAPTHLIGQNPQSTLGPELLPATLTAPFEVKVAQKVQQLAPGTYTVSGTIDTSTADGVKCGVIQTDIWTPEVDAQHPAVFMQTIPNGVAVTVPAGKVAYALVRANNCDTKYSSFKILQNGTDINTAVPATGEIQVAQKTFEITTAGTYQMNGVDDRASVPCGAIQFDVWDGTAFKRSAKKDSANPVQVTISGTERAVAIYRARSCDTSFQSATVKKVISS